MSADINQLTRHGIGVAVERLLHCLIAASQRGENQYTEHRVEQPGTGAAAQVPASMNDHPDNQCEHCEWPHPSEGLEHRIARSENEEPNAKQCHEDCWCGCPSLRLIGPAH